MNYETDTAHDAFSKGCHSANPSCGCQHWTFIYRSFNQNRERMRSFKNERIVDLHLPAGLTCEDALAKARSVHAVPVGAHNNGVWQVQGPEGIWEHREGNKIDFSTPRKAAKVEFKTWDQMDAEDA